MSRRSTLAVIAKLAIGAALIALLLWRVDHAELGAVLTAADRATLAEAVTVSLLALVVVQIVRFHCLLSPSQRRLASSVRVLLVALFLNTALPTSIGGDAAKAVYLQRERGRPWSEALGLVGFERAIASLGLVLLGGLMLAVATTLGQPPRALALIGANRALIVAAAVALTLALLTYDLLRRIGWTGHVEQFVRDTVRTFASALRDNWLPIAFWSVVFHLLRVAGLSLLATAFGQPLPFGDMLLIWLLVSLVAMVPVTVGGLGTVEAAFVVALAFHGMPTPAAAAVALLNRAILVLCGLFGLAAWIMGRRGGLRRVKAGSSRSICKQATCSGSTRTRTT